MADTLENKVEGQMAKNRSLVERIAMYVPFYRGYKQKNLRRDEDRAIRDVVATSRTTCRTHPVRR